MRGVSSTDWGLEACPIVGEEKENFKRMPATVLAARTRVSLQHPAQRDCTMTTSHLSRHSSIVGAGAAICGKTHAAHLRHNVASSFLRFPHRFQPQAGHAMASAKHASRRLDTNGKQMKCGSGGTTKVFRVSGRSMHRKGGHDDICWRR